MRCAGCPTNYCAGCTNQETSMTKLNPADLRDLLDRRATPHERRVVEGLAIADGVLWRCRMKSCAAINNDGWLRCFKCGADRKG